MFEITIRFNQGGPLIFYNVKPVELGLKGQCGKPKILKLFAESSALILRDYVIVLDNAQTVHVK